MTKKDSDNYSDEYQPLNTDNGNSWTRREFFQTSAAALGAAMATNVLKIPNAEAQPLGEIIGDAEPGLYYRDRLPDDQTPTDTNDETSLFDWNFPALVSTADNGTFGQSGMPNSFSNKTQIPEDWIGTPVAVIGAGAAGLCAGFELMKLGLKPVFFEMQTEENEQGTEYARPYGRLYSLDWGGLGETESAGAGWFPNTNTDLTESTVEPNSSNTHSWGRRVAELGGMRFPATHVTLRQYVSEFSNGKSNFASYWYGEKVTSPWTPFRDPGLYKSAGSVIPDRGGAIQPTDADTVEFDTVYHTKGMFASPFSSTPRVPGTYAETYRATAGLTLGQSNDAIRNLTYRYFDLLFGEDGVLTPILAAYSAYTEDQSEANRDNIVSIWQGLIDQYDNLSLREVLAEKEWDDIPAYQDDWGPMNISLTEMFGEIGTGTGPFAMFYYSSFMELLRIALQEADAKQDYFLGGTGYMLQPFLTTPASCRTSNGFAQKFLWNETRDNVVTDKVVKLSSDDGIVRITTQNDQGDVQDYKFSAAILTASPSAIRATNTFGADESLLPSRAFSYFKRIRINNNSKIAINFPNITDQPYSSAFWMVRSDADPYNSNSDRIVTTLTDKTIRQIYTFDNYHWRTQITDAAIGDLTASGTLMLNYGWDYNAQSWSAYDDEAAVREAWDQMKGIYSFSFNPDPYLEWAIDNKQYAVVNWEKIDGFNGAWRMAQPGRGTSVGPDNPYYEHYSEFKAAQTYGMTGYNPETSEYTGLFIAGEATASPGLSGWVEGSLQTGLQAVAGIVRYLNMEGPNSGYRAHQARNSEFPASSASVTSFALHAHPGTYPYVEDSNSAAKKY